jgi:thermitase
MEGKNIMLRVVVLTTLLTAHSFAANSIWHMPNGSSRDQANEILNSENKYVSGELLVGFYPSIGLAQTKAIHVKHSCTIISINNKAGFHRVRIPHSANVEEMIQQYQTNPSVRFAEPNYIAHAMKIPNDPSYGSQWGLPKIDAPQAWDTTTGSSSIMLSVLDTGVDYDHPDLDGGKVRTDIDWDFYNNDDDAMDDHGHGTHCAGILGADTDNGVGVAGLNWLCQILPLKVLNNSGAGYYSDIADGITYATDHGAKVLSLSLGGPSWSSAMVGAVDYAYSNNVIIVAASGNDYAQKLVYPAAYNEVIMVGASDSNDDRAVFSNYNTELDVMAPGVNIYSTLWDNTYANMSGTSMATPHVAGLAGLILARNPSLNNEEIRQISRQFADDIENPGWDIYSGYGRINAYQSVLNAIASPGVAWIHHPQVYGYLNHFSGVDTVYVVGTTSGAYSLYYGEGTNPSSWINFANGGSAISDDTLGYWNPGGSDKGIFTIKLVCGPAEDRVVVKIEEPEMPGWPVMANSYWTSPAPVMVDIDGDGTTMELIAAKDESLFVWRYDGAILSGWPQAILGGNEYYIWHHNGPAIGDVDGDGDLEIVVSNSPSFDNAPGEPGYEVNRYVWLFHHNGTLMSGWPKYISEGVSSPPVLSDLDNDGDLEILIGSGDVNIDDYARVYVWHHNGTPFPGWPQQIISVTKQPCYQPPIVADLEGNGSLEIVVFSGADEWATVDRTVRIYATNGSLIRSWVVDANMFGKFPRPPGVVGDIDNDGDMEIIVGASEYGFGSDTGFCHVEVWHHDSTVVSGWPVNISDCIALSLGDLEGDGQLEIFGASGSAFNGNCRVFVFRNDGTNVPGWPVSLGEGVVLFSPPAVADVDGDGDMEVMASASHLNMGIYVWHHNGTPLNGFPITFLDNGSTATPTLGDLDGDGDLEVALPTSGYGIQGKMHVWDLTGPYNPPLIDWGMHQHDLWHTGWYHPKPPTGLLATPGTDWIDLTWYSNTEPDITGYNVYRSISAGGSYTKVNIDLITDTTYHDAGLIPGQTYFYVVTARIKAQTESRYSSEVNAIIIGVTEDANSSIITPFLSIQPNPSLMQDLRISFGVSHGTTVRLQVFDVCGRVVVTLNNRKMTSGIYLFRWNRKDKNDRTIPSGVYFVRLDTKEFKKTKKMILLQ